MAAHWVRPRCIERLNDAHTVNTGEWVRVDGGFVWLVGGVVLVVDGVVRLDGVVRVCDV